MPLQPAMSGIQSIAAASAAAASLGFLINRATGITKDISTLRAQSITATNLSSHVARLGPHASLYRLVELADPRADALWFEGRTWSYAALKDEVDHLSMMLRNLGVIDGEHVAVFMSNTPEMVFTVYALTRLGAVPALINAALRDDALLHCVRLPKARLVLSTNDLAPFASAAAQKLDQIDGTSIRAYSVDFGFSRSQLLPQMDSITPSSPMGNTDPPISLPLRGLSSPSVLIYTSGTTGKPKACNIKFALLAIVSCPTAVDTQSAKRYLPVRTYSPMPLFHGTTFFIGLCYSVGISGCFCLSRKFSARNYWKEVTLSRATRILYVGELCRFLLNTPEGEFDRQHCVRVASGNGLQKDVWVKFQNRFGIPEVREFYRSTEGLVKFDNRISGTSKRGAGKIGFAGVVKRRLEKDQFIVRFDYDTEEPYRDTKSGFCVVTRLGEAGEGIARIKDWATYLNYHNNEAATEAKIIRNVFEKGDAFQKSGDLMMQELSGWVKFVDRIGDTFRWKGENVSAGEVRGYILELPEVHDVIVTGKLLEGYDGQVGVAIIIMESTFKDKPEEFMQSLHESLKRRGVPSYAVPRLVAISDGIQVGDTFKHAKQFVKTVDWNPREKETGALKYWLNGSTYVPLEVESWRTIEQGTAKL